MTVGTLMRHTGGKMSRLRLFREPGDVAQGTRPGRTWPDAIWRTTSALPGSSSSQGPGVTLAPPQPGRPVLRGRVRLLDSWPDRLQAVLPGFGPPHRPGTGPALWPGTRRQLEVSGLRPGGEESGDRLSATRRRAPAPRPEAHLRLTPHQARHPAQGALDDARTRLRRDHPRPIWSPLPGRRAPLRRPARGGRSRSPCGLSADWRAFDPSDCNWGRGGKWPLTCGNSE